MPLFSKKRKEEKDPDLKPSAGMSDVIVPAGRVLRLESRKPKLQDKKDLVLEHARRPVAAENSVAKARYSFSDIMREKSARNERPISVLKKAGGPVKAIRGGAAEKEKDERFLRLHHWIYSPNRKKIGLATALALVLILGTTFVSYAYFYSTAEIVISPKVTTSSISAFQVTADPKSQTVNINSRRVPGLEIIAAKKSVKSFDAKTVGHTESRARGIITVFNGFGASSQVLIEKTRFQSKSTGLIFRIEKRITVPGAVGQGGNLVSGRVDVEIIADEPGEKYNIAPDDFTIPGFKGTPKFSGFYAKSAKVFSGGLKGEGVMVIEDDLKKAEEAVTAEVFEEARKDLSGKVPPGFVMLPGARNIIITGVSKPRAGEAVKNFSVSADAAAASILFKKDDVYSLVRSLYVKDGSKEYILEDKSDISYTDVKYDHEARLLGFTVGGKLVFASKIDEGAIKEKILRMPKGIVEEYLKNTPELAGFKVSLSPGLFNRMPSTPERIKIKIEL